jgi:hypothetical protein
MSCQKIASEVMVVLTPEEIEKMNEKPTENLEAYQAYLRGRYYAGQPHFSVQNWNLALQNYQSEFDLAVSQLDQLLTVPSWLSTVWIGWDIRFAPLKTHTGYKELLIKHAIKE